MGKSFFARIGGSKSIVAENHSNVFAPLLIIAMLISTLIIPLHALIAFISHEFDIMVANQSCLLAREKARIIFEMYCIMTNYQRKTIENDNKWT